MRAAFGGTPNRPILFIFTSGVKACREFWMSGLFRLKQLG